MGNESEVVLPKGIPGNRELNLRYERKISSGVIMGK
jgi:hypothetical protein